MPKEKLNNAQKRELGRKNPRGEEISKLLMILVCQSQLFIEGKRRNITKSKRGSDTGTFRWKFKSCSKVQKCK